MKFEDLMIYNKDFELLAILPEYLSVNWEIKFCEFGSGEIELEKTSDVVKLLTENKYLFIFQGEIQSVVTGYRIAETVTVYTRTLEWLLTKFVVPDFTVEKLINTVENTTWTVSKLCKYIVTTYLPESVEIEIREILSDESDLKEFVLDNGTDMHSLIKLIMADKKYGFKFYRDIENKRFVFQVLLAEENNDILLCDEYKTSYESEYNFDIQEEITGGAFYKDVKNMGSYNASLDSPRLTITPENFGHFYNVTEEGVRMGLTLRPGNIILCKDRNGSFTIVDKAERFLATIPPEDNGIFSWSKIFNVEDYESVEKEIEKTQILDMLTCKTRLSYLEDFKLGDIIKIKFFAGENSYEKRKLISEIHLWDEVNDTGAMPTTTDIQ